MRSSALLATIVAAFLIGGPAVAEQAGGRITAEQPDIGSVETRIQKYDQALGVVSQLTRVRGRHRLSGRLLFPEQHQIGFLALRAEATMRFALRGQSAGRRVRLSGEARSAAGVPQPRLTQHAPIAGTGVLARGRRISALRWLANSLRQRSRKGNDAPAVWTCDGVGCVPRTLSESPRHLLKLSTRVPGDFLEQSSSAVSIGPRFDSTGNRLDQRQEFPSAAPPRLRR
jgi:hypothetical protein